jgi:hypothetical protein
MTNSQIKKNRAKLFNLLRAEKLAYEMDRKLFPAPKTTHKGRMQVRADRISQQAILCGIALVVSI